MKSVRPDGVIGMTPPACFRHQCSMQESIAVNANTGFVILPKAFTLANRRYPRFLPKMEAGKLELEEVDFELQEYLIVLWNPDARAQAKNIENEERIAPECPPVSCAAIADVTANPESSGSATPSKFTETGTVSTSSDRRGSATKGNRSSVFAIREYGHWDYAGSHVETLSMRFFPGRSLNTRGNSAAGSWLGNLKGTHKSDAGRNRCPRARPGDRQYISGLKFHWYREREREIRKGVLWPRWTGAKYPDC